MHSVLKKKSTLILFSFLIILCMLCALMLSQVTKAEEDYVDVNIYSCGGEIQINQEINGDANHYYYSTTRGATASASFFVHPPEGKAFDGVYTEENGKGELVTEEMVSYTDPKSVDGDKAISGYFVSIEYKADENSDLYINWVDPITVTFDSNGGSIQTKEGNKEMISLPFTPNRRNVFHTNEFDLNNGDCVSKDGKEFLYWSTNPNDKSGVLYSDLIFSEDTTIYAIWKDTEYQVSVTNGIFDKNGYETQFQTSVKKGDAAKLSFTLYDYYNDFNPGNFFGGLYTAPKGTGVQIVNECTYNVDDGTYQIDADYTPTEDTVLHTYWRSGVTLTLDANGGLFEDGNPKRVQNRAPNVVWKEHRADSSYYVPKQKGYEFVGWHTNPNAISGFELEEYMASGSTTLYAVWKELPHEHVEEIVSGKPATCTEDGLTEGKRCSECGEWIVKQETLPAKGHTEIVIKGKSATCTESGLTDGTQCSVCGEWIKPQETITTTGHRGINVAGHDATCTETGLTDGVKCSVCGEWIKSQEVIPATGHKPVIIKGHDSTCAETGLTDGEKCSICGQVLVEQRTIDKKSHEIGHEGSIEPSCTEPGKKGKVSCHVCGEIFEPEEIIPAKGHTKEIVKGTDATCTEDGLTDGEKCSVCGEWLTKQEVIPAKGHKKETVKGYSATCTKDGLTDGEKCSVCGEWIAKQETIKASGHKFEKGVCTVCGEKDPNYKPEPAPTPVSKQNGLADSADSNGDWWFYKDGKIDTTHNGVDQNKYGWWRVENGKVNFNAQGIYQNSMGWWKTTNGKVTFKEEGVFQNGFGWWRVKDSKVDFNAQSIYQNQFGWWKTTNGKVTFKENGLFKNQYGTWKVENSKVNFNFNGKYQGKTIMNGKVV